jgi:hypothetical protein
LEINNTLIIVVDISSPSHVSKMIEWKQHVRRQFFAKLLFSESCW